MTHRKKRIPIYTFWDLDKGKKIHTEKMNIADVPEGAIKDHPFKISHFAIRWVKTGTGKVMVDHVPIDLKANLLFMGNPTQITKYEFEKDQETDIRIIAFTEELITLMNLPEGGITQLYNLSNELYHYPSPEEVVQLDLLFDLIFNEFDNRQNDTLFYNEIIAASVRTLIFFLQRLNLQGRVNQEGMKYRNLYREFIAAIEKNYADKHAVADYSELLFVHEKTLNRACKALTGLTALKIIQNRIDFEAKRLLATQTISVKEIGYQLGFKSSAHFNKFFSNLNDVTPGRFRNRLFD